MENINAEKKNVVVDTMNRVTELEEILPYPYNNPNMIKRLDSCDELWYAAGMEKRPSFNEESRFDAAGQEPDDAFKKYATGLLASCDGIWSDGKTIHIVMPDEA